MLKFYNILSLHDNKPAKILFEKFGGTFISGFYDLYDYNFPLLE